MQLTLDFSNFLAAAAEGPLTVGWYLFLHGGWAIALVIILYHMWHVRMHNAQHHYLHKIKYILLAIDVPKLNEQSTKAVEQIFAQLYGAWDEGNALERILKGRTQESFSLELISLEGYIQFLIHAPAHFRDLVEAAIYAQYPDASIVEVNDYVSVLPKKFPSEEYNLWGTELRLKNKNIYPIRTYPQFEHSLTQRYADPMAAMLEIMSHMGKGENIFIQWVITPMSDDWKEEGVREVKKLIGAKVAHHASFTDQLLSPVRAVGKNATDITLYGMGVQPQTEHAAVAQNEPDSKMLYLSPGQRLVVEGIESKISKIGYKVKGRMLYFAKKEVYKTARGVSGIFGALRQFDALDMNGFAPRSQLTTYVKYFFVKYRMAYRRNMLSRAYRERSKLMGWGGGMILNIEELATVWHFPVLEVKAPSVQMMEAKKGEPPTNLPLAPEELEAVVGPVQTEGAHAAPPSENLPV